MSLVPIDPSRMDRNLLWSPHYEVCVGDSYGSGRIVLSLHYKKTATTAYLTIAEAEDVRNLLNKALRFQNRRSKRIAKIQQASNNP
jgi:hypothetical protein